MIVVFVCVANSARSQMAEGLARQSAPPGVDVYSAGSKPTDLNPHAVSVMHELGIDISRQHSKGFDDVPVARADAIVTLCAEEECPFVASSARRLSWAMPDPAGVHGDDDTLLQAFRAARDEIARRLDGFWASEFPQVGASS